jgi:molybdenum cofactor cytidylyltransferase
VVAPEAPGLVGILLAAGRATRFGGDKLLARVAPAPPCAGSESVGTLACRNLCMALPRVIAVVRPDDAALAAALGAAGASIVRCANADAGMGASLACGVRSAKDAGGWVVALADMPWIEPATIGRVAAALAQGATVAAPFCRGQRGHPVGFGTACYPALVMLGGDDGAKSVVAAFGDRLVRIDVDDAGTLRDVDHRSDLDLGRSQPDA